jgi:hypothetical protein
MMAVARRAPGRTIAIVAVGVLFAWQVLVPDAMFPIGPELWVKPLGLVVFGSVIGAIHAVGPTALGIFLLEGGHAVTLAVVVAVLLTYRTLLRSSRSA